MIETPLCSYRHLAGVPRNGFHAARIPILNLALWDVLGTVVLALIVSYAFQVPLSWTTLVLFVTGTILHILFCVDTTITRLLAFPFSSSAIQR